MEIASHCKFDEGFNDMPIESVPIGLQQLIQIYQNERLPEDTTEIDTKDLDFFVYPFSKKETIKVSVIINDRDKQFVLKLCNDDFMGCTYIKKLQPNSSMDKVSTNPPKINFEIPLLPIAMVILSFTKDVKHILQDLYTQYIQDQGVTAGKNKS